MLLQDNYQNEGIETDIRAVVSDSLSPRGLQPARPLCPWGCSRQECWSGLPFPPLEDLPNPGIEPRSPVLQSDSLPAEPPVILGSHFNF